jgi:PhnO protein
MSEKIEFRAATIADSDTVYALICELKQAEFNRQAFNVGFAANLQDPNLRYQLAVLNGEVVGMIGLHMQFHLHHVNWVGEIQELVVMPQARGHGVGSKLLAWAEEQARLAGAELTELSTSAKRLDAHRFYQREGYQHTHFRFTKAVETSHESDTNA